MQEQDVKDYFARLNEGQFLELILKLMEAREPSASESWVRAHFILAIAMQTRSDEGDGWDAWTTHVFAIPQPEHYGSWDECEGLVQYGTCPECENAVIGLVKKAMCTICKSPVYLT